MTINGRGSVPDAGFKVLTEDEIVERSKDVCEKLFSLMSVEMDRHAAEKVAPHSWVQLSARAVRSFVLMYIEWAGSGSENPDVVRDSIRKFMVENLNAEFKNV